MQKSRKMSQLLICMMLAALCVLLLPVNMIRSYALLKTYDDYNRNFTITGKQSIDIASAAEAQVNENFTKSDYAGNQWCAAFVSDCAELVGASNAVSEEWRVYYLAENIVDAGGEWINEKPIYSTGDVISGTPRRGDIVIYYCDVCSRNGYYAHVAIMQDESHCIHGNYNGKVTANVNPYKYQDGHVNSKNESDYSHTHVYYLRPAYNDKGSSGTPSSGPVASGTYSIRNNDGWNKYFLTASGTSNDDPILMYDENAGKNAQQLFTLDNFSGNKYKIRYSGKVFDVQLGDDLAIGDGDYIDLYEESSDYSYCQIFNLVSAGNGEYYIKLAADNNYAVGIESSSNGARVVLERFDGTDSEKWRFMAPDVEPPTVSNHTAVYDPDNNRFNVNCNITDNIGVIKVVVMACPYDGVTTAKEFQMTISGNKATGYIPVSAFNYKKGQYYFEWRAYDAKWNRSYDKCTLAYTTHKIKTIAGTGGTASASSSLIQTNSSVKVTATPATGYKFSSWSVSGNASIDNSGSATANITANSSSSDTITASANFTKLSYSLTVKAGTGGTAKASASSAGYGEWVTITATPSTGYVFSSWTVSGTGATIDNRTSASTKIKVGTGNVTVTANFTKSSYMVTAKAGTGGTAKASASSAGYGEWVTITATPSAGYVFSGWTVSGTGATIDNRTSASTKIKVGTSNVTVTADFTPVFTLSCADPIEGLDTEIFVVSDALNLTYKWYEYTGSSWKEIIGENTSSLKLNDVTYSMNGKKYRCAINNGACSEDIVLNVIPAEQVSKKNVARMYIDDTIRFVNAFTLRHSDINIVELTEGELYAINVVLIYDY